MREDILAAIDIGSNAIRLLINNIETSGEVVNFKKTAYLRVPIRLGEDVFTSGEISDDKKMRLINAMQGFSYIMKAFCVNEYRACATSAMRDARNGADIVKSILTESGIDIGIIDGEEEADIIYQAGGLYDVMDKDRTYLFVDVGGGSTEIVVYNNKKKLTSRSFQLGTVRMLLEAVPEGECENFRLWLNDVYEKYAPLGIVASGGNINKTHKMLGKREREYVTYAELKELYDALLPLSYEERIHTFKLNPYRADVIVHALKIFLTVTKICGINEINVPKVGLSDGIIRQLYWKRQAD